jgi:hypothetical protein
MKTAPKKKTPAVNKRTTKTMKKSVSSGNQRTSKPKNTTKPARKSKSAKAPTPRAKLVATAFPIVAVIDEQIRTNIPPDLVARVKNAPSRKTIISSSYPYEKMMKKELYEDELEKLQIQLVKMQTWIQKSGERIVMLFEGRDAAGKGGTIKRFTEHLNPRGAHVAALAKPTETERGQWYFQRYIH